MIELKLLAFGFDNYCAITATNYFNLFNFTREIFYSRFTAAYDWLNIHFIHVYNLSHFHQRDKNKGRCCQASKN